MAKATILVVEDEVIVATDEQHALQQLGYEVPTIVTSGRAALEKVEEIRPDLVLMDIRLRGDMDGIQAAEQIRARYEIPVIFVTAYADEDTLRRAKITEPFGYIIKPFEQRELQTNVEMALYKHGMERKLRESEARFRRLAENASDMIYRMSLPDGHYEYVSPASVKVFGYAPEEFYRAPKLIEEIIHPDWCSYYEEQWCNLINGDMPPSYEYKIVHKNGEERWVHQRNTLICDDAGCPVAIEAIVTDFTEYKEMQAQLESYLGRLESMVAQRTAELQAQYARLSAILHSTTDGIIVTNVEGAIVDANPVAEAWLTKTLPPDDVEQLRGAVQQLAAQIINQESVEPVRLLELTGLDLELQGASLDAKQLAEAGPGESFKLDWGIKDQPMAVIAVHDVSHLQTLARMQTSFISNVSHELRTPVTTVKLYLDLLQRRPEKVDDYLSAVQETVDYQVRLVEDILSLSRIDAGQLDLNRSPLPLHAVVAQRVASLESSLSETRDVQLTYQRPADSLMVEGDADRIAQVIDSLLTNALHYTPSGGRVVVRCGMETVNGRDWVWVRVKDTGIGISEQELPHVFERFYRGEKAQQMQASGTGLGLALANEIVRLHGGWMDVESQESVGSVFTIWLPSILS